MTTTAAGLEIGSPIPHFSITDTEGNVHSAPLAQSPTATVVIITCNHCPYVVAWNPRLRKVAEDYQPRGVRFLQINSNDAQRYPADSFEHMQEFVESQNWPIPYLHDPTQEVAHAFSAAVTPHVFVFDSNQQLQYRGAPDGDYQDESQNAKWLRSALDAVVAGKPVELSETPPRGCSVKWKD